MLTKNLKKGELDHHNKPAKRGGRIGWVKINSDGKRVGRKRSFGNRGEGGNQGGGQ